ncbi:AzlD domain-containing protein [Heliobacterium gestii]|uniref:AzlD domain-containing protein n=1 Tax=Heliomicrobium gestii TaxID=2699 RepID=A0A845LD74_HELGE|nr:AzlD domain-containing protein [Heliomicrobium gestii]MBM7868367.1 branched-subunit amino acid transport protein [Heliomicrobium gestii]MZP42425.1 AzlD domain-containing protein [Heliomicrobium gestii]
MNPIEPASSASALHTAPWALFSLVLAMGLVTYLPRMLPLALLRHMKLPPLAHRFLRFIPFAALGALIFPGILSSTGSDQVAAATAGGITAVLLALFEMNLILVVAGGIAGAFLWVQLML